MAKKYIVSLTPDEREQLLQLTKHGKTAVRQATHAHILLKADRSEPKAQWTDEQIADAYQIHTNTVAGVRKRFVQEGLDATLKRRPSGHRPRSLDGEAEAHLIAIACSPAPEAHDHWTLRLLAERMVELHYVEQLSYETVRQTLKKMSSSRG